MTLVDRLPEKGALVGLATYEYIDPRQELSDVAVKSQQSFQELNENLNFANPKILMTRCCTKIMIPTL